MSEPHNPKSLGAPATIHSYEQRSAILHSELRRWVAHGFRVVTQTQTSAQLVKPKEFSFLLALVLVFTLVGFVVYILWYLTAKDQSVHIEVDQFGRVLLNGQHLPAQSASPSPQRQVQQTTTGQPAPIARHKSTKSTFRALMPLWIAIAGFWILAVVVQRVLPAPTPPRTSTREPERPRIDDAFTTTASEFDRRLRGNYEGKLDTLRLNNTTGFVYVNWESSRCEHFEGEVIDLVLSVNRTQQTAPNLQGRRACAGNYTDFKLTADVIQEYKAGAINDSELLRRIQ
jgi:hypothetical protein